MLFVNLMCTIFLSTLSLILILYFYFYSLILPPTLLFFLLNKEQTKSCPAKLSKQFVQITLLVFQFPQMTLTDELWTIHTIM
jgi:hypothetical protein